MKLSGTPLRNVPGGSGCFPGTVAEEMRLSCDLRGAETEPRPLEEERSRKNGSSLMEGSERRGREEFANRSTELLFGVSFTKKKKKAQPLFCFR